MALERLLTTIGTRCLAGPFIVSLHFAVAACLCFFCCFTPMFLRCLILLYDLLQAFLSLVRGGSEVVFGHQIIILLEAE